MKYSIKIYIFLGCIFILSLLLAILLPVDQLFKGIASIPCVAALIGALFQLFRDEAEFEKKKYIQQQEQIFNLGATSHMANVAFDKHVDFCEEYMKEVHQTISTLFKSGPSKEVDSHLAKLIEIKKDYAAWVSDDIARQLEPFEKALNEVGSLSGLYESFSTSKRLSGKDAQAHNRAIKKMYEIFHEILNLNRDPEVVENSEIAVEIVKKKVRSILGVEELTKIRKILVTKAIEFVEKKP